MFLLSQIVNINYLNTPNASPATESGHKYFVLGLFIQWLCSRCSTENETDRNTLNVFGWEHCLISLPVYLWPIR